MKDYFGYQGKVAVVTGSASGMGKAAAEMLVDLGAKVYALDCHETDIDGIEKSIIVDLGSKESINQAFEQLPQQIDSFFGIAGVSGMKTDFNTTVTIDFIANAYIAEEYLINRMNKHGAIAYITSTGGDNWELEDNMKYYLPLVQAHGWDERINVLNQLSLNALPGMLGYIFAKMAMNYYTAYSQKAFASQGIRVNSLLPGSTDTGLKDEFAQATGGEDKLKEGAGYAKRLATSEEMGEPVVFLNSDMACFISGELLVVDYGCIIERKAKIVSHQPFTFERILNPKNNQ